MEAILKGFVSGIVLAFLVGPVFFTIIQTSIERGFRSGFFVAVGVSLSNAMYISIAYLGIYQLVDNPNYQEYLAYIGGAVLLLFGFYYLVIKSRKMKLYTVDNLPARSPFRLFMKGFVINGLSPMVLFFWISTVSVANAEFGYDTPSEAIPYFAAIVATVFITDLIKAKLADRLRLVITPKFIQTLNIVVGLVMLIFGGKLIVGAESLGGL